jgi:hypothetical protein
MSDPKPIFCYETKILYPSVYNAFKTLKIQKAQILQAIDNPNKTAGGYHWCRDLSTFDNVELKFLEKPIYCWELKKWYNSISEAEKDNNKTFFFW